jgi:hypothetical protein
MSLPLRSRERLTTLRALGYRLEISTHGYQAYAPDGTYLGGARALPSRDKPMHWRHAQLNLEMYADHAVTLADSHLAMKGK